MYYVPDGDLDPDRIHQGDIFEEFPCFFLASADFHVLRTDTEGIGQVYAEGELPGGWNNTEGELLIVQARRYKIILVTQTCDIHEEGKTNLYLDAAENYGSQLILYSPVIPLTELANYPRQREKKKEQLENQNVPHAFFLPEHPDKAKLIPDSIVYLPWICSITKTKANRFKTFDPKKRLASLASPYRESFASKYGQTLERVALPSAAPFGTLFQNNKPPDP